MSDALTLAALWVPFTLLAAWVITRSRRHKHACPLCDGTGILREDPTTRRLNNAEAARHTQAYLDRARDGGSDPFELLPAERDRLNGGQRYLGRGGR